MQTDVKMDIITSDDVANFYIDLFKDSSYNFMTKTRIHKFLYYAQAWSLIRLNKPLFNEKIEAWPYGPVVPSVYNYFTNVEDGKPIEHIECPYYLDKFKPDQIQLLLDVAEKYKNYSTSDLTRLTHEKDGPWSQVYLKHNGNNSISNEKIKNYFFNSDDTLPNYFIENMKKKGSIYDKNNSLILPEDWDDEY